MAFLWCWIWITLTCMGKSAAAPDRFTACRYSGYIFTMDCTGVNLEGLHGDMYPVNSPRLLNLILENTGIKALQPDVFSHLTKLTRLDLSRNHLQSLDYRLFTNLTELWSLDITNNKLVSLTDERLFSSQLKLKYLKLSNNSLISLSTGVLTPLVSLKYLSLSGNPFVCDCKLRETMLWCENRNLSTNAVCRYPDVYKGSSWQTMIDRKICAEKNTASDVILIIAGVGVILLVLLVVMGLLWCILKSVQARSDHRQGDDPEESRPEED